MKPALDNRHMGTSGLVSCTSFFMSEVCTVWVSKLAARDPGPLWTRPYTYTSLSFYRSRAARWNFARRGRASRWNYARDQRSGFLGTFSRQIFNEVPRSARAPDPPGCTKRAVCTGTNILL